MWSSSDNLHYISHAPDKERPVEEDECLMISMRNDCNAGYCCKNDQLCTSYTSGQITSTQTYGHGSFYFLLRIAQQTEEYHLESTSFKSVQCRRTPSPDEFPQVMEATPGRGYCMK